MANSMFKSVDNAITVANDLALAPGFIGALLTAGFRSWRGKEFSTGWTLGGAVTAIGVRIGYKIGAGYAQTLADAQPEIENVVIPAAATATN